MTLLYVMTFILLIVITYNFLTRKYRNPYKLIMIFGKKGSGKTTMLTKMALEHNKKGWKVYCTDKIPGTYYIDSKLIGQVEMESNSLLLIDEVGMIYDNRDFKNFENHVRDWFKLQRHRKIKVIMFSQTFDVDLKLRNLTDELFLVTCIFRVFSYAKKINRSIIITKATAENASTIADQLEYESILWFWAGSRMLTFIPKYIKYFDSYSANKLKKCNYKYTEIPIIKKDKKWRKLYEILCKRYSRCRLYFKKWQRNKR